MNPLDSSPLMLFAFAAGVVAELQWLGLGSFVCRRLASTIALGTVVILAVVALVFTGAQISGAPLIVVPASAVDIALKALLVGVLCHRVGWRSWEAYVLIASLLAMSLLIIPWVCLELSKHFFFSQGRPDIYEMWEWRSGSTLYLRVVCDYVAIFALYRRLSRLAASPSR